MENFVLKLGKRWKEKPFTGIFINPKSCRNSYPKCISFFNSWIVGKGKFLFELCAIRLLTYYFNSWLFTLDTEVKKRCSRSILQVS